MFFEIFSRKINKKQKSTIIDINFNKFDRVSKMNKIVKRSKIVDFDEFDRVLKKRKNVKRFTNKRRFLINFYKKRCATYKSLTQNFDDFKNVFVNIQQYCKFLYKIKHK